MTRATLSPAPTIRPDETVWLTVETYNVGDSQKVGAEKRSRHGYLHRFRGAGDAKKHSRKGGHIAGDQCRTEPPLQRSNQPILQSQLSLYGATKERVTQPTKTESVTRVTLSQKKRRMRHDRNT